MVGGIVEPATTIVIGIAIMVSLSFEERIILKQAISRIQLAKENRARRMWVVTRYRTKLYMGGDSRPDKEQIRSGYPIRHLPDDDAFSGLNRKRKAA